MIEPGFHTDLPAEQYHALDCARYSYLKMLAGEGALTLAHVRAAMLNPKPPTKDMQLGTALHTAALQGDQLDQAVAVAPDRQRRSNVDKEFWVEFEAEHAGKIILQQSEFDRVRFMAERILYHPEVQGLFGYDCAIECSGIVQHTADDGEQVLVKIRPDVWSPDAHILADIKTTPCASRAAFQRTVYNFGYHHQAALYMHVMGRLGHLVDYYMFIVVEKEPPHEVAVYRLMPEVIERAWEQLIDPLHDMAVAYRTGHWTGYSEHVESIALPAWAMRDITFNPLY